MRSIFARRGLVLGTLVVLVVALSAGAAGVGEAKQKPAAAKVASGTVVLTGWSVGKVEEELLLEVIAAFERAYPRIKVKYDAIPNYDQSMLAKFSARKPPDVFYLNSEKSADWINQGVIEPLPAGTSTKGFFPRLVQPFRGSDKKLYGLPKDWSPLGMQVNLGMFAKAKIKPPTTWKQLRAAAQKLKSSGAVPEGRPICLSAEWQRMLAFVLQNGGTVTAGKNATFTSPKVKAAVNFYVGLIKSGLAGTPAQLGAGWCGEALGKGKAAIIFEGNWVYPYLPDTFPSIKWKYYEMPKGVKKATLGFTVAYSIGRHSENKEAGLVLLKFLTGKNGMRIWTSKGLALPARSDVKVKFPGPSRAPLLASASYARVWSWPVGFDRVWTIGNNELTAVVEGKQSVNGMLSKMQAEAADTLRRGR